MKNLKSIKAILLCFIFLFILIGAFSKNNAATFVVTNNDPFFPNDPIVIGPGFFSFANSQEAITLFNQQCPNPTFVIDGPDSLFGDLLEVGPAANSAETGSRTILVFDMNGNVSFNFSSAFPLANPESMIAFDPSMGDILGLSIVPGSGFPPSGTFMITTSFNCDDGMSTSTPIPSTSSTSSSSGLISSSGSPSSTSGGSSSGISLTPVHSIGAAIGDERFAKSSIDLKKLINSGIPPFSVPKAINNLEGSVNELMTLQNRFTDSSIMIGMSTIQDTLSEIINNDNEAIMILEPFKNTDPSLTDGEFTQAITKAKKLISEAMRAKEQIKDKLKKLETKGK